MEREILDSVKKIELNEVDKIYMQFPNTGVYSPVSYIPQTIAMRIGLWLNLKPISIYYLVRIFAFLCWFGMMILTFRFLPIKKILFGVLFSSYYLRYFVLAKNHNLGFIAGIKSKRHIVVI